MRWDIAPLLTYYDEFRHLFHSQTRHLFQYEPATRAGSSKHGLISHFNCQLFHCLSYLVESAVYRYTDQALLFPQITSECRLDMIRTCCNWQSTFILSLLIVMSGNLPT